MARAEFTSYGYTMKDIKPVKLVDVNDKLRVVGNKATKSQVIVEENSEGLTIDFEHFILTIRRKT